MSPALFMLLLTAPAAPAQTLPDSFAVASSGARQAKPRFIVDEQARGAWFRKVSAPADPSIRGLEAWGVCCPRLASTPRASTRRPRAKTRTSPARSTVPTSIWALEPKAPRWTAA